MLKNIRVGDRVYMTYHMSNKGVVTELFFRNVTAGSSAGPLTKQMFVKFISEIDGKEKIVKRQDVRKDD